MSLRFKLIPRLDPWYGANRLHQIGTEQKPDRTRHNAGRPDRTAASTRTAALSGSSCSQYPETHYLKFGGDERRSRGGRARTLAGELRGPPVGILPRRGLCSGHPCQKATVDKRTATRLAAKSEIQPSSRQPLESPGLKNPHIGGRGRGAIDGAATRPRCPSCAASPCQAPYGNWWRAHPERRRCRERLPQMVLEPSLSKQSRGVGTAGEQFVARREPRTSSRAEIRVLDLFSGAGGLSTGFAAESDSLDDPGGRSARQDRRRHLRGESRP